MPDLAMPLPMEQLAAFCRKWRIAKLEVFGSIVAGDFRPDSDIDFLYTVPPGGFGGWDLPSIRAELSSIVGRPVDFVSRNQLTRSHNWLLRKIIFEEAQVIYEEAA